MLDPITNPFALRQYLSPFVRCERCSASYLPRVMSSEGELKLFPDGTIKGLCDHCSRMTIELLFSVPFSRPELETIVADIEPPQMPPPVAPTVVDQSGSEDPVAALKDSPEYQRLAADNAALAEDLDELLKENNRLRRHGGDSKEIDELRATIAHLTLQVDRNRAKAAAARKLAKEQDAELSSLRPELRKLQRETKRNAEMLDSLEKTNARQKAKILRLQTLSEEPWISIMNSFAVRDWLCEGKTADSLGVGTNVVTLGSGPFDLVDFDWFVKGHEFELYNLPHYSAEIMIVGREGWTESEMLEQIEARESETLRVFSQELFILALATDQDPFADVNTDVLDVFAHNHPALACLAEMDFAWPEITAGNGQDEFVFSGLGMSDVTPLRELGYTARANGLTERQRRAILTKAFRGKLPWVTSDEYMRDWDKPGSAKRLCRMAMHLNWMSTMHAHHPDAVAAWKRDSQWLKSEFYTSAMRFRWPRI